jgi:hypothetical protein
MRLARRRPLPALLCLLLLFAGGHACAQGRLMSADGGGSCPEEAAANGERMDEAEADAPAPANRRAQKAKPAAVAPRGSTRPAAPRWHSFLPGMFR